MTHVEGTREQMKALMAMDLEGPIHILNQLRFKPNGGREADGPARPVYGAGRCALRQMPHEHDRGPVPLGQLRER